MGLRLGFSIALAVNILSATVSEATQISGQPPKYACEPVRDYDWGMCLFTLDGRPLGNRTPVILIHGWNPKEVAGPPDEPVWPGLGPYQDNSVWFHERFKMYAVVYRSNIQGRTVRDMGLSLRSLIWQMDQLDSDFRAKPLVIIAHSMGGLIARSFMKERQIDSSRFGGDRILGLITLGTPHHGSPFANGPARDVKAGLEAFLLHQLVDGGLFGYEIRWDMDNRYDLHWDNYDGLFDYDNFPESSIWTQWLNESDIFSEKIIAYGGRLNLADKAESCLFLQFSLCLATIMNRTLGVSESDGIVPLKSALFVPCEKCLAVRIFDGYDHSELVRGKSRFFGEEEPLFESIRQDLLALTRNNSKN